MVIFIPTCNRAEMAAGLVAKLKGHDVTLFINNCDFKQYKDIPCSRYYFDFGTDDPVLCSNLAFQAMILYSPDNKDLLIIEDDIEVTQEAFTWLIHHIDNIKEEKYTINPLHCPSRRTRYTEVKEQAVKIFVYAPLTTEEDGEQIITDELTMINQNWVDTNLFIPAALVPEFKEWYRTPPPKKERSNGIGYYHSRLMASHGYPMFTPVPSLFGHGDHDSIIYPHGRKKHPLIAKIGQ